MSRVGGPTMLPPGVDHPVWQVFQEMQIFDLVSDCIDSIDSIESKAAVMILLH